VAIYSTTCERDLEAIRPAAELDETRRGAAVFRLASRGLRLFPVQARSKDALIAEWPRKATCDSRNNSARMREDS
jgi:hypothetical protein